MASIISIRDDRTKFCKLGMMANNGAWNAVTQAWMFSNASDCANALCELYAATRPSLNQRETAARDGR